MKDLYIIGCNSKQKNEKGEEEEEGKEYAGRKEGMVWCETKTGRKKYLQMGNGQRVLGSLSLIIIITLMAELHQFTMFGIICDIGFTALSCQIVEAFTGIVGWEIEMESDCVSLLTGVPDTVYTQIICRGTGEKEKEKEKEGECEEGREEQGDGFFLSINIPQM